MIELAIHSQSFWLLVLALVGLGLGLAAGYQLGHGDGYRAGWLHGWEDAQDPAKVPPGVVQRIGRQVTLWRERGS